MNDQELESGLRAMYRAEVSQTEPVPLSLQRDVAAIPRTATTRRRPFGRGRSVTLLAAAALLLVGGALAVGAGVLRRTPVVPPVPAPSLVAIASAPPTVEASPNVAVTTPTPAASAASPSPASDMQPIAAGRHVLQVLGTGTYPSISVKVPEGWYDVGGHFVNAGPNRNGELSVWDVAQVFRHPCHWQDQAFIRGRPSPTWSRPSRPSRRRRGATAPPTSNSPGTRAVSSSVGFRSIRNRATSVRMGHRSSSDGRAMAQAASRVSTVRWISCM